MPYKDPEKRREYMRQYMRAYQKTGKGRTYQREYAQTHKISINLHRRQRRAANPGYCRDQSKIKGQRLKRDALNAYGGCSCVCCGELHVEFLTIDHILGGGNRHRRQSGVSGSRFYEMLKVQGYPPGYRVLCMNCNASLGWYGYCPHGNVGKTLGNTRQQPLAQFALFPDGTLS
mgnify:FL=1